MPLAFINAPFWLQPCVQNPFSLQGALDRRQVLESWDPGLLLASSSARQTLAPRPEPIETWGLLEKYLILILPKNVKAKL